MQEKKSKQHGIGVTGDVPSLNNVKKTFKKPNLLVSRQDSKMLIGLQALK